VRALLVLVLVLGALFVIVDRVGVSVAEDRVGDRIAEQGGLPGPPEVDITGFPFLTQAVSGTYDEVRIALTAADLGQPDGTDADVALRGVEVPLSDVVAGSVQQVPVDRIDGTATLSYELLSAQLGGDTRLEREGDGLRITRTVELLGQQVPLTAAGDVTLDGSDLVVDVEEAAGAGVELPAVVVDQARDLLDLRYTVPPLPFGLQLTDVRPADDGVVVDVEATGTVIGG
jgi:LmeA-like phospholipid-binding